MLIALRICNFILSIELSAQKSLFYCVVAVGIIDVYIVIQMLLLLVDATALIRDSNNLVRLSSSSSSSPLSSVEFKAPSKAFNDVYSDFKMTIGNVGVNYF